MKRTPYSAETVRRTTLAALCLALFCAAGCDGSPVVGGRAPNDGSVVDDLGGDVPTADVMPRKDVNPGDTAMPTDAPGDTNPLHCMSNTDCVGNPMGTTCNPTTGACQPPCMGSASCMGNPAGNICDATTGLCTMRCTAHADCVGQGAGDICNPTTNMCVARCTASADCAGHPGGALCNPMTGACVRPCTGNSDCVGNAAGAICDPMSGLCSSTCRSHADCTGAAGTICSPTTRMCITRCAADADCAGHPDGAVCNTASGACVQCVATADTCRPDQHCDPTSNVCVSGCRNDDGCPRMTTEDGGAGAQLRCNTMTRICEQCVVDTHCATGQRCSAGMCVAGCTDDSRCATGERCCGGACVNPQTNDQNCGACGTRCMAANADPGCSDGACTIARCASPFGNCDGMVGTGCETNLNTTLAHCGRCGNACPPRANAAIACEAGACAFTCNEGFADCNMNPDDGCETNLNTTIGSCGACGRSCDIANGTPACVMGTCQVGACNTGFGDCDRGPVNGCEVNLRSTLSHCGTCGNACAAPANGSAACSAGTCGIGTCNAGFADCDMSAANGCEVNLNTTATSCGACGRACAIANGTPSCAAGACQVGACNPGFGDCNGNPADGCETNLNTTVGSCGACGRGCSVANATAGCAAGACTVAACATGFADCDMSAANGCEVNTRTDVSNCNACGTRCTLPGGTNVCTAGACAVSACAVGLGDCDGVTGNGCETTITTSLTNCGACRNTCPTPANGTPSCVAGTCGVASCATGFANCDATSANGCEVNTTNDVNNCGACRNACPTRPNTVASCAASSCAYACLPGFADCDGVASNGCEVNTATNTSNCGRCGTACAPAAGGGASCTSGVCGQTCPTGQTNCAGVCRATITDVSNCGTCGRVCTFANAAASCAASACVLGTCTTGFGNCDGSATNGCEANLTNTVANCGTCGRACPAPTGGSATCTASTCGTTCPTGQTNCSNACVDTNTSSANCGACGRVCTSAQACVAGTCVGSGSLRFTLTWSVNGDMDLHVLPPCGTEIYYGRTTACGGTLDVDNTSARGPENINWTTTYTPGRYYVCPEAFTSAVSGATWTLTVVRGGTTIATRTGVRGRTDGNTACNASFVGVQTFDL